MRATGWSATTADFARTVPKRCPKCESEHLYYLGAGSQQGEERLEEIFPSARIGRMDRDTVRGRYDMERLLARLHSGEINLLVGTQMIAKGHDIHGVTLVGVVGAIMRFDAGLSRGRAGISTNDAGKRASGSRRFAGARGGADLLSRSLRDPAATTHDYVPLRRGRCSTGAGCTIRPLACWRMCWCNRRSWRKRRAGRRNWASGC